MKIGFFTNTYLPIIYGSTASVEHFKKGLELLGHEVFVFAPCFKGFRDASEKVFRYPSFQWKYKINYPIAFSIWPPINRIVKNLKLDIIHCHQPFSIGKDGLRQARKNNLPVIFTHHCRYEDYVHYIPPIISKNLLKDHVKKKATAFANQCDQIIAPSQTIKELIKKRGVKKPIEVLPTGIDWERFQRADAKKVRQKFGIKNDEILLLNIGRVEEEKNIEFLFDRAANIVKKNDKVKFLMAGEGSVKKRLIKKAKRGGLKEKIIFVGIIPPQNTPDYFIAGDIFLHTSKSETQGIIINEAMATGTPTVAIEASGAKDMIDNNVNGILTKDSADDFEKAVEILITDEKLREKLGGAAWEKSKRYDYKNQAKKLEEIYEKIIRGRNSNG